jgi:hypothetical protein
MHRKPAPAGVSYFDHNMGCLVTEGPDVCDYKSRIRELAPGILDCYYDTVQQEWIVTQKTDKQEEFLLADTDLARAFERVQAARNDRPGAETGEQMSARLEKEQAALREQEMQGFREIAGDVGERLIHAFKKDGILDHENIYGPKPKPHLARRDVRVRGNNSR